jgi:DNA invertase Pin-like site-specific DNA recombinase
MRQFTRLTAAQYIRMSTDTQSLSPVMQKHAIQKYAESCGLTVVASYEDDGRSGLTLQHRAEMRRLLKDVASEDCLFSVVLVYDVSRWGRFQDTDESAYYEYHCRMHGVEVIYVNEPFERQTTPLAAVIKALKRAMAAEFSRELAIKVKEAQRRALALGFQIGRTPCIGVDRVAMTMEKSVRRLLNRDERGRKGERVAWVHGPEHELALVRRIFHDYANTDITLAALAETLNREGHSARGKAFTLTMLKCLIDCEIFYGEFTWGRRKSGARAQRRADDDPAFIRVGSVMEPIVSRQLWDQAQAKRKSHLHVFDRTKRELLEDLKAALRTKPGLTATELRGNQCAPISKYREKFGSMREAMRLAGREENALRAAYLQRKSRTHRLSNRFRRDLAQLMTREGLEWEVRGKQQLFLVRSTLKLRFKVIWQREHRRGLRWHFQKVPVADCDYLLLVLMQEDETANELLLMTPTQYKELRTWFSAEGTVWGQRLFSARELMEQIRRLCAAIPA